MNPKLQRILPLLLTVLCILSPTAASANAAMGLALTIFPWDVWLIYVAVTVVFEAIALGRWLRVPILRALVTSIGANLLTAVVGLFVSIPVWVIVGFYGTLLNPNPFGHTLYMFTLFGIGSALIEAYLWMGPAGLLDANPNAETDPRSFPRRIVIWRCVAVHLIGVPLGIAILLIPAHPYPGLESQVSYARSRAQGLSIVSTHEFTRALENYVNEHHAFPKVNSYEEALQLLKPYLGNVANSPDLWTAAYSPDYHRFDTGEQKRHHKEWNSSLASTKDPYNLDRSVWLIRNRDFGPWGLVLDPDWKIRGSHDPKELGYEPPETTRSP